MAVFSKGHPPNNITKKCKFLSSVFKDPFSDCHTCNRKRLSYSSEEEEDGPASEFDDAQEIIVSVIRSRAMAAKYRRKGSRLNESSYSFLHSTSGELFVEIPKRQACSDCCAEKQGNGNADKEKDEFTSVQSHFSRCSINSVDDNEAFFSVKTNLSRCSSLSALRDPEFAEFKGLNSEVVDSSELRRRAIIQEFCHCEGWPFGLCRKALLLPPLPKSPSESWSWCKGSAKGAKNH